MTQTFDLNKMGLAPMNDLEMQEVDGGVNWYFWGGLAAGAAANSMYRWHGIGSRRYCYMLCGSTVIN